MRPTGIDISLLAAERLMFFCPRARYLYMFLFVRATGNVRPDFLDLEILVFEWFAV